MSDHEKRPPLKPLAGSHLRIIEGGEPTGVESLQSIKPSWEFDITKEWISVMSQKVPNFIHPKNHTVQLTCVPRIAMFIINFVYVENGEVTNTICTSGLKNDDGLPPTEDDLSTLETIETMLKANSSPLAKEMLAVANIGAVRRSVRFGLRERVVKGLDSV